MVYKLLLSVQASYFQEFFSPARTNAFTITLNIATLISDYLVGAYLRRDGLPRGPRRAHLLRPVAVGPRPDLALDAGHGGRVVQRRPPRLQPV